MEIQTGTRPKAPTGSAFAIERIPFPLGSSIDVATVRFGEGVLRDWPMVYILANENEAYVGQTTSVIRRMGQHGANPEKADFTTANLIFNAEANMSVVTDYESQLIQYMSADGKYVLTNKNGGIVNSNYYSKAEYDEMFKDLWSELRNMELADHSIDEIEESEVFKYSPYKSLSEDQRAALERIVAAIVSDGEKRPIVVQGMPGTGKTVLAIYLLKALKDDERFQGMSIKIVEPVTSLRETLRHALKGIRNLSKDDVIGPSELANPRYAASSGEKPFDILLVDEAHRLKQRKNIVSYKAFDDATEALGFERKGPANQLDWVLRQSRIPILFYDANQVVGPSGISPSIIESRIAESCANPISLDSQMRVKGGKAYLDYVAGILRGDEPAPRAFDGYELVLHEDFRGFYDSFERRLQSHELTRMVAGYAWKWRTKKDRSADAYDMEIDGVKVRWNCTTSNWVGRGFGDPQVAREMGVIHTIQGYDLSYAYVVMGNDIVFDEATGRITVDPSSYYDVNGKKNATDEELEAYIKNIYYVLMTRGVYGTHLYVCNPALRRHLARFLSTTTW